MIYHILIAVIKFKVIITTSYCETLNFSFSQYRSLFSILKIRKYIAIGWKVLKLLSEIWIMWVYFVDRILSHCKKVSICLKKKYILLEPNLTWITHNAWLVLQNAHLVLNICFNKCSRIPLVSTFLWIPFFVSQTETRYFLQIHHSTIKKAFSFRSLLTDE